MIINRTNKKIISEKHKLCSNALSKTIGLMFHKKNFVPLVFSFKKEKITPLHMLFVFFPIDIIFVDRRFCIVEIKENFKPFAFYTPINKSMYIIELPQGAVRNSDIKIGGKIEVR